VEQVDEDGDRRCREAEEEPGIEEHHADAMRRKRG
jgi:hypothetical protein